MANRGKRSIVLILLGLLLVLQSASCSGSLPASPKALSANPGPFPATRNSVPTANRICSQHDSAVNPSVVNASIADASAANAEHCPPLQYYLVRHSSQPRRLPRLLRRRVLGYGLTHACLCSGSSH